MYADTVLGSVVVIIVACHATDRGSIPRQGGSVFFFLNLFVPFLSSYYFPYSSSSPFSSSLIPAPIYFLGYNYLH